MGGGEVIANELINGSHINLIDGVRRDNIATDVVMDDDGDEDVTDGGLRDVEGLRDSSLSRLNNHKLALGGKVGSLIGNSERIVSLVDRNLPLGGKVGFLVGGNDRIISKNSQSFEKLPLVFEKLSLGGKVGFLVGGSNIIVLKDSQSYEKLLSDRVELRNLTLEDTLDYLLGKMVNSEGSTEISRDLRSDDDVPLPLSLPSSTVKGVKSKKDNDAKIPTHLWLRLISKEVSKSITKGELNNFVPVIQGMFLLLRLRRNVTSSF